MSRDLSLQRCFNHGEREAVARCPGCHHYFCRECITEHEDRIICARCLQNLSKQSLKTVRDWAGALVLGRCVLGLLAAWFFFYLVGEALLALPASFHEGTYWQVKWWH